MLYTWMMTVKGVEETLKANANRFPNTAVNNFMIIYVVLTKRFLVCANGLVVKYSFAIFMN